MIVKTRKLEDYLTLVDCPTQLTLMTWICQLSRRCDPSKGGSKIFGASLRLGKDIWRRFDLRWACIPPCLCSEKCSNTFNSLSEITLFVSVRSGEYRTVVILLLLMLLIAGASNY